MSLTPPIHPSTPILSFIPPSLAPLLYPSPRAPNLCLPNNFSLSASQHHQKTEGEILPFLVVTISSWIRFFLRLRFPGPQARSPLVSSQILFSASPVLFSSSRGIVIGSLQSIRHFFVSLPWQAYAALFSTDSNLSFTIPNSNSWQPLRQSGHIVGVFV